jgi:pyruvate formate lyase activating enzyme
LVEIKGLEKFAPLDFRGFISSTIFLGGCNFRCPYCHNADLVLRPQTLTTIPLDFFVSYLDSRKGWLEGICVSGGEPLLDDHLEILLRLIKERNLLVKLDTNGSRPDRLEDLIGAQLVDQVAMDVKAPLGRYREVTRSDVDGDAIVRSIEILRESGLSHMFRTTLVPGLVGERDLLEVAQMLHGAKLFQVQQFSRRNTVDTDYLHLQPFPPDEVSRMAGLVKPYFAEVRVEGI